jgi:ADP-ribose pyrophosphatase YjhB (NUDIX family)
MRVGNVRCIIKNDNKILLCFCKKENHYFLPGGGIEFQELAENAIFREIKEEMVLEKEQVKINSFIGIIENMYADKHGLDLVFDVSLQTLNVVSQEAFKIDFFWKDLNEIDKLDIRPKPVKEMIKNEKINHVVSVDLNRKII